MLDTRNPKEKEALGALALAQEARHLANSSRLLAAHPLASLEVLAKEPLLIVAVDADGRLSGAVQPAIWQIKRDSILRAFLASCNGVARHLILPDPQEADAPAVVGALLEALTDFWQRQDTDADLLRWPAQETRLLPLIAEHGFQLDSVCAFRALDAFFSEAPITPAGPHFRIAQPSDEVALLRLFHEELLFHERATPFVRSSPAVLQAFQQKLERLWQGERFEDGAPLIVVAQQGDTLVAMAESTLLTVSEEDDPGFTPPGRYWCIENVSVLEPFQGQGIGHVLVQMIESIRLTLELDLRGYVLWYNPDNTTAVSQNMQGMRADIDTVSVAVAGAAREAVTGTTRIQQTGQFFETIFGLVEEQASESEVITRQMEQLYANSVSVVEIMETVSLHTQTSRERTRQTAQEMQELTAQAQQLRLSVEVFKLKPETSLIAQATRKEAQGVR